MNRCIRILLSAELNVLLVSTCFPAVFFNVLVEPLLSRHPKPAEGLVKGGGGTLIDSLLNIPLVTASDLKYHSNVRGGVVEIICLNALYRFVFVDLYVCGVYVCVCLCVCDYDKFVYL